MKVSGDSCNKCKQPFSVSLDDFHLETFETEDEWKEAREKRFKEFTAVIKSNCCVMCYVTNEVEGG